MPPSIEATAGSPRPYFVRVVMPTYARFIEYYVGNEFGLGNDTRNANEAAEALLHLADRIHHDLGGASSGFSNPTDLRRALFKRCEAYAIVNDVALAAKHHAVERGEGYVRSSDAILETFALDRYVDSEGVYFRYRKLLEVALSNNKRADLGHILFVGMSFWSQELVRMGIIPEAPMLSQPLPMFVARPYPDRIRKFKMLGQVGEHLSSTHRIFFYRYVRGMLTPPEPSEKLDAETLIEFEAEIRPSPFGGAGASQNSLPG